MGSYFFLELRDGRMMPDCSQSGRTRRDGHKLHERQIRYIQELDIKKNFFTMKSLKY